MSADLYDIPILIFKYLNDLDPEARNSIKFDDLDNSINYTSLMKELLCEIRDKILILHIHSEGKYCKKIKI